MKTEGHTREAFENKPVKRGLYDKVVKKMLEKDDKGCVTSLCGPAAKLHAESLMPLLRSNSELLFAEWDKELSIEQEMEKQIKECNDKRIVFKLGNIWDVMRSKYIYKKGWQHKHVLFDLDFCRSTDVLIAQGLQLELKRLARSKLPRKSGFWIYLTVCKRGDRDEEWLSFSNKVLNIFTRNGWSMSYTKLESYKDVKGPHMVSMLFRFKWNDTNNRK